MEANAVIPSLLPAAVLERFRSLSARQKWALLGAVVLAIAVATWGIYYSTATYKPVAEKITSSQDREDVIRVLDQMGVESRVDGDRVLVRDDMAGRASQALARVGLPKSRTSMAEAMRQMPFGTTSFHEQIVEAEARQNEIASRIEEMDGVRRARVIIHIPKPSVFLRDEEKPTAAVTVYMHKGFTLDRDMVRSVASIVSASGVPEESVKVIDGRTGKVANNSQSNREGLNNAQLEYIEKLKREREDDILRTLLPITGQGRVSATVNVDVDFSKTEQTSENFKPNPQPNDAVIRSQHIKEGTSPSGSTGGVPGALSNQPPGAASAPLVAPPGGGVAGGTNSTAAAALLSAQRETVVNYEVDKTIRHIRGNEWGIKRVTASVVVNVPAELYNAKNKSAPFKNKEDFEKQVNDLIKGAIGFDERRGDTIQVLNTPFAEEEEVPVWKNPRHIAMLRDVLINLVWGGVVLYLVLGVIRPTLRYLFATGAPAAGTAGAAASARTSEERRADEVRAEARAATEDQMHEDVIQHEEALAEANAAMQRDLNMLDHELAVVQAMIRQDPRMAAQILKEWMNADE